MDKTVYNLPEWLRYGKNGLLILFVLVFLSGSKAEYDGIRILFVGDILLSRNVKEELDSRKSSPWENFSDLFHSADLVAGNLEGAVGQYGNGVNERTGSPVFGIDSTDIPLLKEAGFNYIAVENNHSLDFGQGAKDKTTEVLLKCDLKPVCFNNSPQFFSAKGVTVSILSFNTIPGDSSSIRLPSVEVGRKIRLAKSLSNVVIVFIHWGNELLDWPGKGQREMAGLLVKYGADIIIGTHPHVIQKPELIEGKPVFFSIGNHLFDQKYPVTKTGLIADIRIKQGVVECKGILTHTQPHSFFPGISSSIDFGFEPFKYNPLVLEIGSIKFNPVSVNENGNNQTILQAFQKNNLIWETNPLPIVSVEPFQPEEGKECLFILEKHYSPLDHEMNVRPYVYSIDSIGINAMWRGSSLAWPIIDARVSPEDNRLLCALHRGDSFICPDEISKAVRIAGYRWNGFGFRGTSDSTDCKICQELFKMEIENYSSSGEERK